MELPLFAMLQRTPRVALTLSLVLFSLTIAPALYSFLANPTIPLLISSSETDGPFPSDHMHPSVRILPPVNSPIPAPLNLTRHRKSSYHSPPVTTSTLRTQIRDDEQRCDLFKGEWIPNEESPYYNNATCWAIQEHQNCMKFGRPDTGFMRWRWKPDGCDLPIFDPNEFLEMVRGKSMGFVGHWHYRPSVYYENNTIIGCHYCQLPNISDFSMFYGYRKAFRTAFKAILDSETFEGVMYLRTFAPSHFEGGLWNEGGNCLRKGPYQRNETQDDVTMKLHKIQVEEFERAEVEAKRKGKRFRLLDTTQAMWLRPDGHPSRYGHLPEANVSLYNDCVHWCLPGPIDNLNDFLLAMIKREEEKGLLAQVRKMMS
ncbi:hypothetical protein F2Q69_00044761 [Brassica cretica]|uniref:Trichome birefringence-like N-terminal domain-containing protein n=1 Tax=Brassica cretica TaxID=69181 RepID=A0A8S9N8C0_BRACR|nr:hypothetical protein F2Q69_00044761 [Brassica cretica]